ncbi:uncharacterized protein [Mytilus edulis]|uniref:uncharacterized protein n=1 Tax=Mytilus edulis TaxID=6550 RepID=UPI0039EF2035
MSDNLNNMLQSDNINHELQSEGKYNIPYLAVYSTHLCIVPHPLSIPVTTPEAQPLLGISAAEIAALFTYEIPVMPMDITVVPPNHNNAAEFPTISDADSLEDDTHLHKTAVIIIMSILIFISLSISAAVLVFCKKKNSVFSYQKSEQGDKDYEYEMDDINTENESSDSMETSEPIRSQTYPSIADVNSSSNKIRYKFIPKSNTFSGIDYCGLDMSREHSNNFSLSNSLYSSSSPSLNFQSLTIKVDVEPCLQSQSSECLTDYSVCNDNSSTYITEHDLNSHSTERFQQCYSLGL